MNIFKSFRVVFFPRPTDSIERELEQTKTELLVVEAKAEDRAADLEYCKYRYDRITKDFRGDATNHPELMRAKLALDYTQDAVNFLNGDLSRLNARITRLQAKLMPTHALPNFGDAV